MDSQLHPLESPSMRPSDETSHICSTRGSKEAPRNPTPTSSLLQDLLREKKAANQRMSRASDIESQYSNVSDSKDPREIHSSPVGPTGNRGERPIQTRRPSGQGVRSASAPKQMGLREMEEYISKLKNENFDLKLDLKFCRQRTEALESQLEKMKSLEEQITKMQEIKDKLLQELEKRDQATKEAVTMICNLEEKLEEAERSGSIKTPSTTLHHAIQSRSAEDVSVSRSSPPSSVLKITTHRPVSVFQEFSQSTHLGASSELKQELLYAQTTVPKSPPRQPSFLRRNSGSSSALRSLYLDQERNVHGVPSFASMRAMSVFSQDEDAEIAAADRHGMRSPPLSILSERSFTSLYGKVKDQEPGSLDPDQPDSRLIEQHSNSSKQSELYRDARINQWIDGRGSPSRRTGNVEPAKRTERISSIGQMLQTQECSIQGSSNNYCRTPEQPPHVPSLNEKRGRDAIPHSPSFVGPMFGTGILPETRDSSTRRLLDATPSTSQSFPSLRSSVPSHPAVNELYENADRSPNASKSQFIETVSQTLADGAVTSQQETLKALRKPGISPATSFSPTPYGTDLMFNGYDYFPPASLGQKSHEQYQQQSDYGGHPVQPDLFDIEWPVSSRKNQTSLNEHEWLGAKQIRQTPSPSEYPPHPQEFKNPKAQNYQQLVTPLLNARSNKSASDTIAKPARSASLKSFVSKISNASAQHSRSSMATRMFRRSSAHPTELIDDQPENQPFSEPPALKVTRQRARSTGISAYHSHRSQSQRGATPTRTSRPGTANSADPKRPTSSYMSRRPGNTIFYDSTTTTSEEGIATPSSASHDDFAVAGEGAGIRSLEEQSLEHDRMLEAPLGENVMFGKDRDDGEGRKRWSKASAKVKKGLGWKRTEE